MQFEKPNFNSPVKRAASCTSAGSITVESALTIPIFLFAVLCLIYVLEIHAIQTTVQMAAHTAAKEVAQQVAVLPEIETGLFRSSLIRAAGADRLNRSLIVNGSNGIRCFHTQLNSLNQLEVCVEYEIALPFPEFVPHGLKCQETFLVKCWTGYQKGTEDGDSQNGPMVYITDHGSVYHADRGCSYLNPSIQVIPEEMLGSARNKDGSRYKSCEDCGYHLSGGGYYVTEYGEKYHTSLSCNGLKRTIHCVSQGEAAGMGGCSKCVK